MSDNELPPSTPERRSLHRLKKPVAVLAAVLAVAACGSKKSPTPSVTPECLGIMWGYNADQQPDPHKTNVTVSVIRKAGDYTVNKLSFVFGDGQPETTINDPPQDNLSTEHTYPTPGEFVVNASFTVAGLDETFYCPKDEERITIAARQ